jgi:hypothetical protein
MRCKKGGVDELRRRVKRNGAILTFGDPVIHREKIYVLVSGVYIFRTKGNVIKYVINFSA